MKAKESIRLFVMIAGISIGIFVAVRFAESSTRMAVFATSQYIHQMMSSK